MQYLGGVIEEMRLIGNVENNSGIVMLETDWVFASGLSSATALPSASLTASVYVKMSDLTFSIGDVTNVLAAGDAIAVHDFTFRIKNNWKIERGSASAYIIQPVRDLPREVTLDFTVSKYSDNTVVAAIAAGLRNHTQLQAVMSWASGAETLAIYIPRLYGADIDNMPIADDKILALPVKLKAHLNANNAFTGMSTITEEFTLTTTPA
jgi:hypothetical protein